MALGHFTTIDLLRDQLVALEDELDSARRQLRASERQAWALEAEVAAVRRQLKESQGERAALEDSERIAAERVERQVELIAALAKGIAAVRGDIERVAESRSWRLGHGVARSVDRLRKRPLITDGAVARALARLDTVQQAVAELERAAAALHPGAGAEPAASSGPAQESGEPDVQEEQRKRLARRIRSALGPPPETASWPAVSIVVLNRNGEDHLRRLLRGLERYTDYPQVEVVVVDNGSSDGSVEYLRGERSRFAVTVIENVENVSFSEGNRQGAERATGELLLFLNNDIEPFESGWLRELVAVATRPGVGAAGATLLHAEQPAEDGIPLVQHRGIRVRELSERLAPYNFDDGGAVFSDRFGEDINAPAATGAALMIAAERFAALGASPAGIATGLRTSTWASSWSRRARR